MFRTAMGHFLVHFLGYSLNSERKAPEDKFCRLPEHFQQAAQSFFALFCAGLFQYPVRVAGHDRFSLAAVLSHLRREQILLQPPLRTGTTVQQAGN